MKNNRLIRLSIPLLACLMLASCNDIIEKNISNQTPVVILPQVNDTVNINPVHIKWEKMDGATKYHIQIVSPSFASIDQYTLDSVVFGTNFYFALDSNSYEMKLTAMNAGYESLPTSIIPFVVGVAPSSTSESIVLVEPLNNSYFDSTFNGYFNWNSLPDVSSYTFELHEGSSFAGNLIVIQDQLETTDIQISNPDELEEGEYNWGIKAYLSSGDETVYSKRSFFIDKTDPGQATLSLPLNGAYITDDIVVFSWVLPADAGTAQSPILSTIEVATNSTFATIVSSSTVSTTSTSIVLASGFYYWRIKTTDEAGNIGQTSSTNNFTVAP